MADRDILTVLFTDIVGSTAMRTRLGDDRADEVLALHDRVVREAAAGHDGTVVKHTGDGAMVSFRSARAAVDCAIAVQRELDSLAADGASVPEVRVGINAGEVAVADDGDLFGQAVNAAARVAATAGAGEIVIADVVRSLVGHQPGFDVADHGQHALAGFDEPWQLHVVPWRPIAVERELQLLGDVRVCAGGRRIEAEASPRALLLLAALALARGRPVDRAELAYRLWPDSSDQQARTNLRKVVHELRGWLDDGWIEVDQRRLRLRVESVTSDVVAFRAAVDAGDGRQAAAHYAGPLLPGSWDDWVIDERRGFEAMAVGALHRHLDASSDPAERVAAAQRLLEIDRVDEAAHRALIEAHASAGNRSAALRAFHSLTAVLERDLGVAPSPETVAVYEAVRGGDATGTAPRSLPATDLRRSSASLIGREDELAWLQDAWADVSRHPARRAVLVAGESGVGKSRLVDELAAICEREAVMVLRARAYESDAGRALAPVVDWLRAAAERGVTQLLPRHHRVELARLLPELETPTDGPATLDPAEARALLFDAAAATLDAAGAPLLLVLDDLQWCGADTVDFLGHLLRRGPSEQLLVATTRRDHERAADPLLDQKLADLRAEAILDDRHLGRLRPVHTAALARATTDRPWSEHELAELHVETDGHPLFVIEAAKVGPGEDHLTSTVRGVIERRLAQLPDDRRKLLEVAAVFGRRFGPDELALAARRDADAIIDAIDDLWQLGLVVEDGTDFDFGHDQFRETVLAGISPARCGQLHRRVAAALVAHAGDAIEPIADRVAEHYERAGLADEAIEALVLAARRATRIGAHEQAIRHLERALHLLTQEADGGERELRVLTELGTSYAVLAGYGSAPAQETWRRAERLSARLGATLSGPVHRGLALAAISSSNFPKAVEHGDALCRLHDATAPVEGHYVLGVTAFWQGDLGAAADHLERAMAGYEVERAREHVHLYGQDPKAVCGCRLAYIRLLQGRSREADELLHDAESHAEVVGDAMTAWYVWTYRVIIDRFLGRPTVADHPPPQEEARGFFIGTDLDGTLWPRAMAGDADAERVLEVNAEDWRDPGHNLHLTMHLALLAELRIRRGDPDGALAHLDEADAFTERMGQHYLVPELRRLRAQALRTAGDPAAAAFARAAVDAARAAGARALGLRARTELLRCTADPVDADELRSDLDALRPTHFGIDVDEAEAALATT